MRLARTLWLLALAPLAAATPGCGLLRTTIEAPGNLARAATGTKRVEPPDPGAVQAEVLRLADEVLFGVGGALIAFQERAGTEQARNQTLHWGKEYGNAALSIATGAQPLANLVELLAFVSIEHRLHEQHWSSVWGESDEPVEQALAQVERDAWEVVRRFYPSEFLQEIEPLIQEWTTRDLDPEQPSSIRMGGFQELLSQATEEKEGLVGGLFGALSLDPLASLEPAAREIALSRLMAERALYFAQRAPMTLGIEIRLLVRDFFAREQITTLLGQIERLTRTADSLPATLSAEREAAIDQISRELTLQRTGLLQDLERSSLTTILGETRATLEAGERMSTSLDGTLTTLDAFVGRFDEKSAGAPEEKSPPQGAAPAVAAAPAKPFDIVEYGLAAERIGGAARELSDAIATLDQSLPQVESLLDESTARLERGIARAERALLLVVLVAVAATTAAVALLRRLRQSPPVR